MHVEKPSPSHCYTFYMNMVNNILLIFYPIHHYSGLVKRRWQPLVRSQRSTIELVLKGNFLEIKNEVKVVKSTVNEELNEDFKRFWAKHATAPLQGRNIILSSFCPQV